MIDPDVIAYVLWRSGCYILGCMPWPAVALIGMALFIGANLRYELEYRTENVYRLLREDERRRALDV